MLLNLNAWFREPFSPAQIVSWILIVASAFLAIHAARLLHTVGRPDARRTDDSLFGLEKTTRLITVGAYRYIRFFGPEYRTYMRETKMFIPFLF